MKLEVIRTSTHSNQQPCENAILENGLWIIEINSLEELLQFLLKIKHRVIINSPRIINSNWMLEIYDDYREG